MELKTFEVFRRRKLKVPLHPRLPNETIIAALFFVRAQGSLKKRAQVQRATDAALPSARTHAPRARHPAHCSSPTLRGAQALCARQRSAVPGLAPQPPFDDAIVDAVGAQTAVSIYVSRRGEHACGSTVCREVEADVAGFEFAFKKADVFGFQFEREKVDVVGFAVASSSIFDASLHSPLFSSLDCTSLLA